MVDREDGRFITFNADLGDGGPLRDDRSIAFNAELGPEGPLYELRNLVAAKQDLELCYRGNNRKNDQTNNREKIIIYYNSRVMFDVVKQKNNYKLSFSFNHARYEENWKKILEEELQAKHYFGAPGDNRDLVRSFKSNETVEWNKLYDILQPIYENYFKLSDEIIMDYFSNSKHEREEYLEKIRQQQIFSANTNCDDGYFFYDLEFSKRHKNGNDRKEDDNNNKPDMLAVKFEKGRPTKLVFVELKTTKKACMDEKSSVEKHLTCMVGELEKYEKNRDNKFLKARKDEAPKIIAHYAEIGLRGLKQKPNLDGFSNIDIEFLLIFTDEAIEWAEQNRKNMESWARKYLDKLVITKSDESGKILPLYKS